MNLLFNATADFEQDLQGFDATMRQHITERVNQLAHTFVQDKAGLARQAHKPCRVQLKHGYDSSLYSVRVGPATRLILAIDDDPVFEQVIVTLLRVVPRSQEREVYAAVAQAIYGHLVKSSVERKAHLNGQPRKQEVSVG